jgi:hypothetical protein
MGKLTQAHLRDLGRMAASDREYFFERRPDRAFHGSRILCVALCQGGAVHWIDGQNGVNDLDVHTFYADGGGARYPPRRKIQVSYHGSGLTNWSERVDLLGRSIPHKAGEDSVASVVGYLKTPRSRTASELARKAVVLIDPTDRLGEVIWPVGARRVR